MLMTIWAGVVFLGAILLLMWTGWSEANPNTDTDDHINHTLVAVLALIIALGLAWPAVGAPMVSWLEQALPQTGENINLVTAWGVVLILYVGVLLVVGIASTLFGDWLYRRRHPNNLSPSPRPSAVVRRLRVVK